MAPDGFRWWWALGLFLKSEASLVWLEQGTGHRLKIKCKAPVRAVLSCSILVTNRKGASSISFIFGSPRGRASRGQLPVLIPALKLYFSQFNFLISC